MNIKSGDIVVKKTSKVQGVVYWTPRVWGAGDYSVKWEGGGITDGLTQEELNRDYETVEATAKKNAYTPRYKVGDKLHDSEMDETGIVDNVDVYYNGEVNYSIRWTRSGLARTSAEVVDKNHKIIKRQEPVILLGKKRGRCNCGAWTVKWMEGHHTADCPEFRNF